MKKLTLMSARQYPVTIQYRLLVRNSANVRRPTLSEIVFNAIVSLKLNLALCRKLRHHCASDTKVTCKAKNTSLFKSKDTKTVTNRPICPDVRQDFDPYKSVYNYKGRQCKNNRQSEIGHLVMKRTFNITRKSIHMQNTGLVNG